MNEKRGIFNWVSCIVQFFKYRFVQFGTDFWEHSQTKNKKHWFFFPVYENNSTIGEYCHLVHIFVGLVYFNRSVECFKLNSLHWTDWFCLVLKKAEHISKTFNFNHKHVDIFNSMSCIVQKTKRVVMVFFHFHFSILLKLSEIRPCSLYKFQVWKLGKRFALRKNCEKNK